MLLRHLATGHLARAAAVGILSMEPQVILQGPHPLRVIMVLAAVVREVPPVLLVPRTVVRERRSLPLLDFPLIWATIPSAVAEPVMEALVALVEVAMAAVV